MKKWLINGLGIVIALCLALGGLTLMDYLLKEKRERYLSASGGLDQTGLSLEPSKSNSEQTILSKEELKQVLSAMRGREVPHEPLEGQLSMEQAIELGKEWVREYCLEDLGLLSDDEQKYHRMDARLCRRQGTDSMENPNILYSYWMVSLTSREIRADLVMNAVTGQVLDARLTSYTIRAEQDGVSYESVAVLSDEAIWKLLERYIASFGLKMGRSILMDPNGFYHSIEDGELFAMVQTGNHISYNKTDYSVQYEDSLKIAESEGEKILRLFLTLEEP